MIFSLYLFHSIILIRNIYITDLINYFKKNNNKEQNNNNCCIEYKKDNISNDPLIFSILFSNFIHLKKIYDDKKEEEVNQKIQKLMTLMRPILPYLFFYYLNKKL